MVVANHRHAPQLPRRPNRGSRFFVVAQVLSFLLLASGIGLYAGDAYRKFTDPHTITEEDMGMRAIENTLQQNLTDDSEDLNISTNSEHQSNALPQEQYGIIHQATVDTIGLELVDPVPEEFSGLETEDITVAQGVEQQVESSGQEDSSHLLVQTSINIEVAPEVLSNIQDVSDAQPHVSPDSPVENAPASQQAALMEVMPDSQQQNELKNEVERIETAQDQTQQEIQYNEQGNTKLDQALQNEIQPEVFQDNREEQPQLVNEQHADSVPQQEFETFEQPEQNRQKNEEPMVEEEAPQEQQSFEANLEHHIQEVQDQNVVDEQSVQVQEVYENPNLQVVQPQEIFAEQVQQPIQESVVPEQLSLEGSGNEIPIQQPPQQAAEVPVQHQPNTEDQNSAEHIVIPLVTIENVLQTSDSQEHFIPIIEDLSQSNPSEDLLPPETPQMPAQNQLIV